MRVEHREAIHPLTTPLPLPLPLLPPRGLVQRSPRRRATRSRAFLSRSDSAWTARAGKSTLHTHTTQRFAHAARRYMAPRLRYVYSPTLCSTLTAPRFTNTRNRQRWRQVPQRHHALRSLRHGTITAAPVAPQPLHAIPKSYILFILGLARSYLLRLLECTLSFYVNPFPHALKKFLVPNTFAPSLSTTRPPSAPLTHYVCSVTHPPLRTPPAP